MSERQKLYRPMVTWNYRGAYVWCQYGHVTSCGQWIDAGEQRWRRTDDWFATEQDAKASKANEVEALGRKLLEQAESLRNGGDGAGPRETQLSYKPPAEASD